MNAFTTTPMSAGAELAKPTVLGTARLVPTTVEPAHHAASGVGPTALATPPLAATVYGTAVYGMAVHELAVRAPEPPVPAGGPAASGSAAACLRRNAVPAQGVRSPAGWQSGPVPAFPPVRPGGGRHRLRRAVWRRRRALAVSLAASATATAALAATVPRGAGGADRTDATGGPATAAADAREGPADRADRGEARPDRLVTAPVRIADPAAVRLLRPGDRVDVLAAAPFTGDGAPAPARVVARRAEVAEVPVGAPEDARGGGLLVLAVPPETAAALAGAAASAELAVARW